MHCTFDTPPPQKKKKESGVSCAWCPLSVLRGRRSLPPLSPAGSPAAACCSRPAQSASEPAGSWRGKKPSRESSQGDQCVRACLCVSESERERESRTGNQRTRAHTRALSVSTDFYSLRASCRPPQRAQKAAIRTRKVAQFFFFLRWWLVLCRGARCPAEDSLAGTGSWFPPQKQRLSGGAMKN